MSFDGLRVLSLESRRAREMEALIARHAGVPFVAPSVRERPLDDHAAAFQLVEQLEAGRFDLVVCMTGVGVAFLRDVVTARLPVARLSAALRRAAIIARGPKPVVVLRALEVPIDVVIQEPNTWREVVAAVAVRSERRIAVQEYGRPNVELYRALEALGAEVTPVALYRWALPEDTAPLREAAARLAAGAVDVVLFTSSIQLDHLLEIAGGEGIRDQVIEALATRVVVASVGAVMTETLEARGIPPDIVPVNPKMGVLVKAAAEQAAAALHRKRSRAQPATSPPASG